MSSTALITEYNPFHNGHQYHLNKSREISSNDDIIVIMNGNFTQRAEAALLDKWLRTEQALSCGADMVIELPLVYGIRSAEFFADYSIKIIEKSNMIDTVVFGSELGQIKILELIAEAFNNEKEEFKKNLSFYLNKGLNYPKARAEALLDSIEEYPNLKKLDIKLIKQVLASPNNILGIEYLKSIKNLKSDIKALTIKRIGPSYYSDEVTHSDKDIASATHIRKIIYNFSQKKALKKIKNLMPLKSWQILKDASYEGRIPTKESIENLYIRMIDNIRRKNPAQLKNFFGISAGLENRIYKAALTSGSSKSMLNNLNAKNYTESRIKRKLLQIYFNLQEKEIKLLSKSGPNYIRVLGINKNKEYLLGEINNKSELPVIINPSQLISKPDFDSNSPAELSISFDVLASDLYSLLYQNINLRKARQDYYQQFLKI